MVAQPFLGIQSVRRTPEGLLQEREVLLLSVFVAACTTSREGGLCSRLGCS